MTTDTKHVWVVEYYADWCGHCKNFAKGYEKAATNLKGIVKFGAVNADEAKSVMQMAGVQSFPTIKLYEAETTRNPYTGKMMKTAIDYNGPRNARALVEFATSKLPSFVTPVTDKSATAFKANGALPKALLFTSKSETAPMFKAISLKLQGRMLLGEAREKEAPDLAREMGVASYPALLVLPGGEAAPQVYDGELKPAALTAFLASHALEKALPGANDGAEGKDGKGKGAGGAGGAGGDSNVVEITSANVAELVEGERDAWVLLFPGTDDSELPGGGLEGLGEQLLGQAKVGKAAKELAGKFGIKELASGPTLAVWPFRKAGVKRKAVSFKGTEDGLANAKKAALDTLPDEYVTQVNSANADRWMQEAMMTSEAKAFAILFSDKPVVPPLFR